MSLWPTALTHKTAVVTGVARPTAIGYAVASHLFHKHGYSIIGIDITLPPPPPLLVYQTPHQRQQQQQYNNSHLSLRWLTPAQLEDEQITEQAIAELLATHNTPSTNGSPSLQQQQQQQQQPVCLFLQVDLSQPAAILGVRQQLQELGVTRIHTLVNNAGIADPYMPPPAADGSNAAQRAELFSKYIAVNLSAAFLLTEALLPMLSAAAAAPTAAASTAAASTAAAAAAGGGRCGTTGGGCSIIHISSTRALQSEPHCEGYGAAKAGLLGLTHAQAASLADRGIRVNTILPGWIDTTAAAADSAVAAAAAAAAAPESSGAGGAAVGAAATEGGLRPEDHAWHWVGRVGVPADVAQMVGFLADGAQSGFITGQQFVVDGGVTKRMTYPE